MWINKNAVCFCGICTTHAINSFWDNHLTGSTDVFQAKYTKGGNRPDIIAFVERDIDIIFYVIVKMQSLNRYHYNSFIKYEWMKNIEYQSCNDT